MKNRFKKIKREHSIINGLADYLVKISKFREVKSIIPGRIKPIIGNYPSVALEFQYKTDNGFKCIAKSERSCQEVFIVTNTPDQLIKDLEGQKLITKT